MSRTYKNPSKKIPVKINFCVRFVCKNQTIGIGKQRIITSVSKLVTPLPTENATKSMNFGLLIVRSQKAATGIHWKMVAKKTLIYQQKMIPAEM